MTDDILKFLGTYMDAAHASLAIIIVSMLGRAWHAAGGWRGFMRLGGLVGIVKSLLFGTNTPNTPPQP